MPPKPPEFLKPGDVVTIGIDGIGTLRTDANPDADRPGVRRWRAAVRDEPNGVRHEQWRT